MLQVPDGPCLVGEIMLQKRLLLLDRSLSPEFIDIIQFNLTLVLIISSATLDCLNNHSLHMNNHSTILQQLQNTVHLTLLFTGSLVHYKTYKNTF